MFPSRWGVFEHHPWQHRTCVLLLLVAQSCLTVCNPAHYSPPASSVQARILEWVAISFSRGSSQPRNRTWVSCIAGRFFTVWDTTCVWIITNLPSSKKRRNSVPLSLKCLLKSHIHIALSFTYSACRFSCRKLRPVRYLNLFAYN